MCFNTNRDPSCLSVRSNETPISLVSDRSARKPHQALLSFFLESVAKFLECVSRTFLVLLITFQARVDPPSVGPPGSFSLQSVPFIEVFPKCDTKSCYFSTQKFALVPRVCCVLAKLTTVKGLGDAHPRFTSHRFPCLLWYHYVLNNLKCWVPCCVLSVVYLMLRIVSQKLEVKG